MKQPIRMASLLRGRGALLLSISTMLSLARPGAAAWEPLVLGALSVEIPEVGFATNMLVRTVQWDYTFRAPEDWRLGIDTNAMQFTWISRDNTRLLRFGVAVAAGSLTSRNGTVDARPAAELAFPSARVSPSFAIYTCGLRGTAFDLHETVAGGLRKSSRLAVVPYEGGRIEFLLTTPGASFDEGQVLLTGFLNSFRVAPRSVGHAPFSPSGR